MKSRMLGVLLMFALTINALLPFSAFAETAPVTIDPIGTVSPGNELRISGTSDFAQLIVYVYRPDDTVLYYKQLQVAAADKRYSVAITVPENSAQGTYTVVAGYGAQTANARFEVKTQDDGASGSTRHHRGGGGSYLPPTLKKIDANELSGALKDGKAFFRLDGKERILLPVTAAELLKDGGVLSVAADTVTLDIPAAVLQAASSLAPADRPASSLVLILQPVDKAKVDQSASDAAQKESAKIVPAGAFYEIRIGAVLQDGSDLYLELPDKPLSVLFQYGEGTDRSIANVYAIGDGGALRYIPTKSGEDAAQAALKAFGQYGLLQVDKSYADVPADFWAAPVIRWLSAKQIVSGVEADRFDPQAAVTRAQFAALLVRGLGLETGGTMTFADVRVDDWFAPYVAAAAETGSVNGTEENVFSPNEPITREAMAAMAIRAYERLNGKSAANAKSSDIPFADRQDVSDWAAEAVGAASQMGLIKGSDRNLFKPKSNATRAESAQILANLLGY